MKKFIKKHKIVSIIFTFMTIVVITTFYLLINKVSSEAELLRKYDLEGLSVTEIVSKLDSMISEDQGFKASISATKLTMSEDNASVEYKVPDNLFYLSFAPYINNIHPCQTHSLMSCRGEMINKTFDVTITKDNGNIILSKELTSMENGFIGVWLPRNIKGTIKVTYNDLSVENPVSTYSTDYTCMTTPLKLK